jgi:hypothetical protein
VRLPPPGEERGEFLVPLFEPRRRGSHGASVGAAALD